MSVRCDDHFSVSHTSVRKIILVLCLAISLVLPGCQSRSAESENKAFRKFTNEIFCQETASNTISIHYTLKNPEEFGIEETKATFGQFSTDACQQMAAVENLETAMEEFAYKKLDMQNRLTYDVMIAYLERAKENAKYLLYEEPLGLVSGIQTQLPVVLSEYPLENRSDVDTYLALMRTTPEYFDSLIAFERKKAEAGLFMPDKAAKQVMAQCNAFMSMGENNYLISTFAERIKTINELSEKEKSKYIEKNALMLNSYVLPSYSKLMAAVEELRGTGKNEAGLCYYPNGKEYYEHIVQSAVGSERTVREMQELTKQQIIEDIETMEEVLGLAAKQQSESEEQRPEIQQKASEQQPEVVKKAQNVTETGTQIEEVLETASIQVASEGAVNPVSILKTLEEGIEKNFPKPPETNVDIKYVPKALQAHLSPAFYMIPAIDDYENNVIYVNEAHMGNNLTLFTTLAHEGYPGHLYQTIYYADTNPDPIRNIFNFGGYVEGWATYAEMASYSLAPLKKEQAVLLQRNSSMVLGLYTLADIGIHYDGWSKDETAAFFADYGLKDTAAVNRIYNLIIGSPGNYLKYYIGYLEFLELKKEWIQKKGEEFSQKEFHEAVLSIGPAPFELVEKYMWEMEKR